MTNKQKLAKLNRLRKELFPDHNDRELQDLTKIYEMGHELSGQWFDLLQEAGMSLGTDVKFIPQYWIDDSTLGYEYDCMAPQGSLEEFRIIPGTVLLGLLDNLRKELGPNPKKALILADPDGYTVVKLRSTTGDEIDHCCKMAERLIEVDKEEEQRGCTQDKQATLKKLIERLGLDTAIRLLESSKPT